MSKRRKLLSYALSDRRHPAYNRKRVGVALSILSVFLFLVFLTNFAIIIITGHKFGQDLKALASQRHQTTLTVQATRGTIYDRNGIPIADDSTTYSIYAILSKEYVTSKGEKLYIQPKQYDKVANILAEKLGMEESFVREQLNLEGKYQVAFGSKGNNISYGTKVELEEAFKEAKIKGMGFTSSPGRLYPNGVFASHFIGMTQLKDNNDGTQSIIGQNGLEYDLNDILSGKDGVITYEKTSSGVIKPGTEQVTQKVVDGQDVYTTLSESLQSTLESYMDIFQSKANGVRASATVVAAKTGEILATTQRPTFDSDTKEWVGGNEDWNSALYQNQYEPGSTMKVMTLAAGIDSGKFDPTYYYNNASYTLIDTVIKDWDVNQELSEGQYMTLAQGFAHSSNIAMLILQQAMGDTMWLNYLGQFDFGLPTRFGTINENFGLVNSDNQVTIGTSAFGQGISVTQIQMLKAFTAIANKGELLTPKFIAATYDPNTDTARKGTREVVGKPVSENAATQTLQYMVTVGTDPYHGTLYSGDVGAIIQVNGVPAAVKSGTSQIAKDDGSGYIDGTNATINSVVAMYPPENPEFIMYVTLQQPEHWNPIFWMDVVNPVLEEAVRLNEMENLTSPTTILDDVTEETTYKLPNVIGKAPGSTAAELRRHLLHPVIIGSNDEIEASSVEVGSTIAANQRVLLWTGDLTKVPDMYGWTEDEVKQFEEWSGITIKYKGSGKTVTKQSIKPDTSAEKLKKITVTLGE